MSQSELLSKVIDVLEKTAIPYMLTGSYVSSLQGEPRLTHDIDIVVALEATGVEELVQNFPLPDYYLDPDSIQNAIDHSTQFNLLDNSAGDKVDFWLLTKDPFDQSRFARRYVEEFQGRQIQVSRPEDTIVMKLRWAEMSGGSNKQMGDALGVYELQRKILDTDYIEHWAQELKINELWKQLKSRSGQILETSDLPRRFLS